MKTKDNVSEAACREIIDNRETMPRMANEPPQFSDSLDVSAGNELDSPLTADGPMEFINSLGDINFLKPAGPPDASWNFCHFMSEAGDAAVGKVLSLTGSSSWDELTGSAKFIPLDNAYTDAVGEARRLLKKNGRLELADKLGDLAGSRVWDLVKSASRLATGQVSTPRRGNAPPQFSGGLNVSAGNELGSPLTAQASKAAARAVGRKARKTAVLMALVLACCDLPLQKRHINYADDCWNVWRRGYALECDVDGELFVFEKPL